MRRASGRARNIVRHGRLVEPHAAQVMLARMSVRVSDGPGPAPDAVLRGISTRAHRRPQPC